MHQKVAGWLEVCCCAFLTARWVGNWEVVRQRGAGWLLGVKIDAGWHRGTEARAHTKRYRKVISVTQPARPLPPLAITELNRSLLMLTLFFCLCYLASALQRHARLCVLRSFKHINNNLRAVGNGEVFSTQHGVHSWPSWASVLRSQRQATWGVRLCHCKTAGGGRGHREARGSATRGVPPWGATLLSVWPVTSRRNLLH